MDHTAQCDEIRALLELSAGPLLEARSRAQQTGSVLLLDIAADLGRARQYLTDAHATAHAACLNEVA